MVSAANNSATTSVYDELDNLTQAELENIIENEASRADDARYVLARLLIEGTSPQKVPANDTMGNNYLKTAVKNSHLASIEYKTYYDIRFAQ